MIGGVLQVAHPRDRRSCAIVERRFLSRRADRRPTSKRKGEQVSVSRILADRSNTWFLGGEVDVEKKKRVHS